MDVGKFKCNQCGEESTFEGTPTWIRIAPDAASWGLNIGVFNCGKERIHYTRFQKPLDFCKISCFAGFLSELARKDVS